MAVVCAVLRAHWAKEPIALSEMFAENSGRYSALMCATERLPHAPSRFI